MSFISVVVKSSGLLFIFLSPTYISLCASLFIFGFGGGIFQVAVNSMVSIIEHKHNISIMSTCHGFFSLGGLLATGFGTFLLIWINHPIIHAVIAISSVLLLQLVFFKQYYQIKAIRKSDNQPTQFNKQKFGVVVWLALIAISVLVSEGAIADWSGLYLKDIVLAKAEYVGLGYATFSLAMTIGRFSGDYFSRKYGSIPIIFGGFSLSILGFILVLTATWLITLIGFLIIGLGFSIIVPEVYRLAANIKGVDSATGVAYIAGAGFFGFLGGPVAFGFIAEALGLTLSFTAMLGLAVLGIILVLARPKLS